MTGTGAPVIGYMMIAGAWKPVKKPGGWRPTPSGMSARRCLRVSDHFVRPMVHPSETHLSRSGMNQVTLYTTGGRDGRGDPTTNERLAASNGAGV